MGSPYGGSRLGTRFGPYELQSLIGVGGMGEVYRAYDTVKDRMVAVKLLRAEVAADPGFQERFRRESRVAARLQEPHVIPVHDFGDIGGVLYIDMRLVEGANLKDILRTSGPLDPARAASIIEQVAAALDAAHADGLVHRDIKPENVLLTPGDFAYLVDFGIAHAGGDASLTMTGAAIGSCAYMAPERFRGGRVGPNADVYSLACVLYECLTGRPPFPAGDLRQVISAHLLAAPPRPSVTRPGLSPGFDDVIARAMAKQPPARFSSAGELARAATATAASAQSPTPAHPRPSQPPSTRQFSAVFQNPTATGYTPYSQPVRPPERPVRRRRFGRAQVLLAATTVVMFAAAAGIAALLVSRHHRGNSPPETIAAVPPPASTATETIMQTTTTESPSTTLPTSTTSTTAPTSPPSPSGPSLPGTDGQGFVGYYARCDPGNPAAVMARTTQSLVVVCQNGSGNFYYRGVRLSDGASIQLANAVRSSGGFDVSNPVDGTRYEVRPDRVNIISGQTASSEPVLQYSSS
jgi:serine/threonine protein kinase